MWSATEYHLVHVIARFPSREVLLAECKEAVVKYACMVAGNHVADVG